MCNIGVLVSFKEALQMEINVYCENTGAFDIDVSFLARTISLESLMHFVNDLKNSTTC